MPLLEKLRHHAQALHWTDSIPLEYHYTVGVAGEDFRRELKENGKFLSSKCPECGKSYVPARMFCPTCFVEMKEQATVNKPGYVYSFTEVPKTRAGKHRMIVVALVKFQGFEGGLVHQLEMPDTRNATLGMRVEPVLRERAERTGALTDILAFRPTR